MMKSDNYLEWSSDLVYFIGILNNLPETES